MTLSDQPPPPDTHPSELSYLTVTTSRDATLIQLAVVFNYIIAGADILAALAQLGLMGFMFYAMRQGGMVSAAGGPIPPEFMLLVYPIYALFALSAATLNFLSAQTLRRRSNSAIGWTLAAGVVNCFALLWCSLGCVIPLAAGVYSIVIVCLEPVRALLRNSPTAPVR